MLTRTAREGQDLKHDIYDEITGQNKAFTQKVLENTHKQFVDHIESKLSSKLTVGPYSCAVYSV